MLRLNTLDPTIYQPKFRYQIGVGSAVIELAKKILKLTVIATASRQDSIDYCKKFGADHVINHKNDLKEELKKVGLDGVDYVFNCADAGTQIMSHYHI